MNIFTDTCVWVKKCMEYEVEGTRPRGRPKKTWREIVEKDCRACGLNTEDAMVRSRYIHTYIHTFITRSMVELHARIGGAGSNRRL